MTTTSTLEVTIAELERQLEATKEELRPAMQLTAAGEPEREGDVRARMADLSARIERAQERLSAERSAEAQLEAGRQGRQQAAAVTAYLSAIRIRSQAASTIDVLLASLGTAVGAWEEAGRLVRAAARSGAACGAGINPPGEVADADGLRRAFAALAPSALGLIRRAENASLPAGASRPLVASEASLGLRSNVDALLRRLLGHAHPLVAGDRELVDLATEELERAFVEAATALTVKT